MDLGNWVIITLAVGIGIIFYRIIKIKYGKEWSIIGIVTCIVSIWVLHKLLDQPIPGSFFEKGNYKVKIYVYAFPNSNKVKSYKVPALIERDSEMVDTGEDNYSRTITETNKFYRVLELYMPIGGQIIFEDDNIIYSDLKGELRDVDGQNWLIEITKELVK
jgi:hypothetical protein